jgi:hypothetical protein
MILTPSILNCLQGSLITLGALGALCSLLMALVNLTCYMDEKEKIYLTITLYCSVGFFIFSAIIVLGCFCAT